MKGGRVHTPSFSHEWRDSGDSYFGLSVEQFFDLAWPAVERTDAKLGCRHQCHADAGRCGKGKIPSRLVLFEILCLGRLFTIPVCLPGRDACVSGLMRKCGDGRPVPFHVYISYLFCLLGLCCNESH